MPAELEPNFPLEFIVRGTPVSRQAERTSARAEWKDRVKNASQAILDEGYWATERPMSVTLFYFPASRMQGDIDNIVKLTLDAMSNHIFVDDAQVERVLVQKFEPGNVFPFISPSSILFKRYTSQNLCSIFGYRTDLSRICDDVS